MTSCTAVLHPPIGDKNHSIHYTGVDEDLRGKVRRAVVIAGSRARFHPFLQGDDAGWMMVEMWTDDPVHLAAGVAHFEKEVGLPITKR